MVGSPSVRAPALLRQGATMKSDANPVLVVGTGRQFSSPAGSIAEAAIYTISSVSVVQMPAGPRAAVGTALWRAATSRPAPLSSGERIHSVIRNTGSTRPTGLLFHRFFCGCRHYQFWLCFGNHFGPESQVPRAVQARGRAPPLAELQAGGCNRG